MPKLKSPKKVTKQKLIEAINGAKDIKQLKRLAFMLIEDLSKMSNKQNYANKLKK